MIDYRVGCVNLESAFTCYAGQGFVNIFITA